MSLLTDSLKTAADQNKAETADEQAAIGRAALKKQRQESSRSLAAALESHRDNGKAKVWRRRIATSTMADNESGREIREVAVFERADAYGEREFLRLANGAAAAAVVGGWGNAAAVESVGAELVSRVLAKTSGRMPKRGSLGRTLGDSENPDAAYLTAMARRLIGSALAGDRRHAGLAAEAFPTAAAEGAETADLAGLAAESLAAAEPETSPYLADPIRPAGRAEGPAAPPRGDYLTTQTRTAVKRLAVETGTRPAAVIAATVSTIRPAATAADLAAEGYGKTGGAVRTAASRGRDALAGRFSALAEGPRHWTAADWRRAEALAILSAEDRGGRVAPHICEGTAEPVYRAPKLDWPMRRPEPAPWRNISADSLAAYAAR